VSISGFTVLSEVHCGLDLAKMALRRFWAWVTPTLRQSSRIDAAGLRAGHCIEDDDITVRDGGTSASPAT